MLAQDLVDILYTLASKKILYHICAKGSLYESFYTIKLYVIYQNYCILKYYVIFRVTTSVTVGAIIRVSVILQSSRYSVKLYDIYSKQSPTLSNNNPPLAPILKYFCFSFLIIPSQRACRRRLICEQGLAGIKYG